MQRTDILSNGYKIIQDDKAFCFGIDAVLLASFTKLKKGDKVFDLGCGNGIVPLLLCGRSQRLKSSHVSKKCHFIGVEIQKAAAQMARQSVQLNKLEVEIEIAQADLKETRKLFPPQCADVVTANPPYMLPSASKQNSTDEKTIARHEVLCSLNDVVSAAKWLLKPNGYFCLIHRPYRLQEIFSALEENHLTPRRMQLVYPTLAQPPEMVLLEARPNYKPDLKVSPPLIMYDSNNEYTEDFKRFCGM